MYNEISIVTIIKVCDDSLCCYSTSQFQSIFFMICQLTTISLHIGISYVIIAQLVTVNGFDLINIYTPPKLAKLQVNLHKKIAHEIYLM